MALSDFKFSDTTDSDLDNRTPSFFKKRFTRTWTEKHRNKDGDDEREDTQHRVGLRLLHSSPEPLIDLIFVHGLKGHPVKTWRKSGDPRSFWPQYWLPVDPGFHHVNIHTFGYEADWANSKASNILNIHDFGQSLLEEMRNSPCLRHNERVRIHGGYSRDWAWIADNNDFLGPHHSTWPLAWGTGYQKG